MPGFRDCIVSARDQGVVSAEEADDLIRRYEAHRRAQRGEGADDAAKRAFASELEALAAEKRRQAEIGERVTGELRADLEGYRGPDGKPNIYEAAMRKLENFGFSGYQSVAGKTKAIISLAHGELADVLRAFERNFYTGFRHDKPLARDVVREIFGEGTGRPEAKAFADAISRANEMLRQRFNAAGGHIGELDGGYLPQFHDPAKVHQIGFEAWRDFILPRLDLDRMRDPLTGGPLTPDRLGESLKAAFDAITTDGWAGRTPTAQRQGRGALANQRADHRFLHFKSADDWLAYDREFGRGDPILTVFQHINGMARDIAAMEELGPNPGATIEWLKQVVLSEHAKARVGDESLFNNTLRGELIGRKVGDADAGQVAAQRIEDLWHWVRGRQVVNQQVVDFASNTRNFLTSAQLGSAVVTAATTDPAIERATRQAWGVSGRLLFGDNAKVYLDTMAAYFADLPILKGIAHVINGMTGAPREQALRAGMIWDDFLHIMGDEARYAGTLNGNFWSRWVADRTLMLSGLTPLTEARRAQFQLTMQGFFADMADKSFAGLPERARARLEGYGIGAADWDSLRATAQYRPHPDSAGLIRPIDVAAADRDLAERYVGLLLGETERAVPTGTLRSRSTLLGASPRGNSGQELLLSFTQYRSFGLSLMTLQLEALAHEGGISSARGASYAAQTFLLTTLGGAIALQLKNLANGRDPQNMKDVKFWMASAATGGGLGLYGDFLFADVSRFGHSLGEQVAGPTVGLVNDLFKLTLGNMAELAQGKDTNFGRELPTFAGRYTPVVSSLWYTRLAWKRELMDQLQYHLDPRAARRWREEERRALRERGQGFWWQPGERAPSRPPDWSRSLP